MNIFKNQALLNKCLVYLVPTLMIYRLIFAMGYNLRIIWPIYAITLVYGIFSYKKTKNSHTQNKAVLIWMIYALLSSVSFLFIDVPFECFISELYVFILPIFFVFIGSFDNDDRFYKYYVYSTLFCVIVGLWLFLTQPAWYSRFLLDFRNNAWYSSAEYDTVFDIKFASFFGSSYAISFFATFASCIVISDFYRDDSRRLFKSKGLLLLFLGIFYIGALLCRHRVAIIFPPAMFAFYIFKGLFNGNKRNIVVLIFLLAFIGIIAHISSKSSSSSLFYVIDDIQTRLTELSLDQAMEGGRAEQNESVLRAWNNIILGDGLGSRNGNARSFGLVGITDGNYVKLLVELGVVGFIWFMYLIASTLFKGLKHRGYYSTEIWIILYMLFAMTGSNGLCIEYYYSIIFWYAIGRVWNSNRNIKVYEQQY